MKRIQELIIFLGLVFGANGIQSQENELNCSSNFKEAIYYLEKSPQDSLQAIANLSPCVDLGYSDAQLLMGRLCLNSTYSRNYAEGFRLVQLAAEQNNAKAACDLGVLYKYGKGCALDLEKSREWFERAAALGSSKAMYSLGYLCYKGVGTIPQDYEKAVSWFLKSTYPMANYWLAQSLYYGYGLPQDKEMAIQLLEVSVVENLQFLIGDLKEEQQTQPVLGNKLAEFQDSLFVEEELATSVPFQPEKLKGLWDGYLLQYDWSATRIVQKIPVTFSFPNYQSEDGVECSWIMNNEKNNSKVLMQGEVMYFEQLNVDLPRVSFDIEQRLDLNYQMLSAAFSFKTHNEVLYAVAIIESFVADWQEPGAPMRLVLKRAPDSIQKEPELSEEVMLALAFQEQSFIKVYPNPFSQQLLVAYELDSTADVEVSITSFDGQFSQRISNTQSQNEGTQYCSFSGADLENGTYVIRVSVNGDSYSKLIQKK